MALLIGLQQHVGVIFSQLGCDYHNTNDVVVVVERVIEEAKTWVIPATWPRARKTPSAGAKFQFDIPWPVEQRLRVVRGLSSIPILWHCGFSRRQAAAGSAMGDLGCAGGVHSHISIRSDFGCDKVQNPSHFED